MTGILEYFTLYMIISSTLLGKKIWLTEFYAPGSHLFIHGLGEPLELVAKYFILCLQGTRQGCMSCSPPVQGQWMMSNVASILEHLIGSARASPVLFSLSHGDLPHQPVWTTTMNKAPLPTDSTCSMGTKWALVVLSHWDLRVGCPQSVIWSAPMTSWGIP